MEQHPATVESLMVCWLRKVKGYGLQLIPCAFVDRILLLVFSVNAAFSVRIENHKFPVFCQRVIAG